MVRYRPPVGPGYYDHSEVGVALLKARRRDYTHEQTILAEMKKTADRDFAREIKELTRFWLARQKAVQRVIDFIEPSIGNRPRDWPIELAEFMNEEFHAYELAG